MIHLALKHVVSELNAYLNLRSPSLTPDRFVAGSLFDLDGNVNTQTRDRVVLSVVNVEEDPVYRSVDTYHRRSNNVSDLIKPEVKINLYLLFVANLGDYEEALKALAHIVSFFQHHSVFEYADIPALADREGRFVLDLYSMSFEQQNHLWGALGAKYMPSVMYKMGIVDIRDTQVAAEVPPVEEILTEEPR